MRIRRRLSSAADDLTKRRHRTAQNGQSDLWSAISRPSSPVTRLSAAASRTFGDRSCVTTCSELTAHLRPAAQGVQSPVLRVQAVCRAYLDFPATRPHLYRVLFERHRMRAVGVRMRISAGMPPTAHHPERHRRPVPWSEPTPSGCCWTPCRTAPAPAPAPRRRPFRPPSGSGSGCTAWPPCRQACPGFRGRPPTACRAARPTLAAGAGWSSRDRTRQPQSRPLAR